MCVRLACLAALALAGCSSRQEGLRDDNQRACDRLVPGNTLRQVDAALPFADRVPGAECRTDWRDLPVDACAAPPAEVCEITFQWLITDPGLCNPVGAPCADYCLVRVEGRDLSLDATTCAYQFVPRQRFR